MNVNIQKYAPPVVVLGIALYLGWPPPAPMDLGEDVVRAKSVRWKVGDLDSPKLPIAINDDPFAAVLVDDTPKQDLSAGDQIQSTPEEPYGPTLEDLQKGLKLGGIAQTDTRQWAIVNGRVCREGERVLVVGLTDTYALIRQIQDDQITVVVGELTTNISQEERKRKTATPSDSPMQDKTAEAVKTDDQDEDEDEGEGELDPSESSGNRKRSGEDPTEQFFQSLNAPESNSSRLGWGNTIHSHVAQEICQTQLFHEVRKTTR